MKIIVIGKTGCRCRNLIPELEKEKIKAMNYGNSTLIEDADVIFAKPNDIEGIARLYPGISFCVAYLSSSVDERRRNALEDGFRPREYARVEKSEEKLFSILERWVDDPDLSGIYPHNVTAAIHFRLEHTGYAEIAETLCRHIQRRKRCERIVRKCVTAGSIDSCKPGTASVYTEGNDGSMQESSIPIESYVDISMATVEGMASLMDAYLDVNETGTRPVVNLKKKKGEKTGGGFEQLSFVFKM